MSTRFLLVASAIVMALLGLAGSFGPREILIALNVRPDALPVLLVQITGALYLGFAMLNWMVRGSLLGGIYGRPVAFGNFLHLMVVSLALLKALVAGPRPPTIIVGAIVYGLLCGGFGWVLFTPPRELARQGEG